MILFTANKSNIFKCLLLYIYSLVEDFILFTFTVQMEYNSTICFFYPKKWTNFVARGWEEIPHKRLHERYVMTVKTNSLLSISDILQWSVMKLSSKIWQNLESSEFLRV